MAAKTADIHSEPYTYNIYFKIINRCVIINDWIGVHVHQKGAYSSKNTIVPKLEEVLK